MIDFIELYSDTLSHQKCEAIINYIDSQNLEQGKVGIVGNKNRVVPSAKDAWQVGDTLFSIRSFVEEYLLESLVPFTQEYVKKHPQIDLIDPWELDNGYNLQKYDPGQCYHALHCENGFCGSPRMLVWMIYLNTVTEGGGTYFDNYDRIIDAVEGRLVIWPASWTHTHRGVMSHTQTKYIATGWYSFMPKFKRMPYISKEREENLG